ncbi:hypothetical protein [Cerasicoccus arenae]|uniref:Uncharacterized protein n=1 Tax=Cerasicoccus arenae TaxID=424488 RepID=A0A8J3GDW9_9BACT|nr:hypothetical protein [Cerasicoccus arenae]MBK1858579.1 hypothetical protein [Cerasicoccus arenae]GHC05193.1 hypothetical protein GCM10007047_22730 [Cerasicoccus arenae]
MKFKDRLIIFFFGAILGMILVTIIKSQRAKDRPEAPPEVQTAVDIQRAATPGILQAYRERGQPMQSDFIVASKLYPHPDEHTYRRVLILQGQEPEQTLRIEETVQKVNDGELVESVRVMSADRVVVELAPGAPSSELATAVKSWGYRITERGQMPDQYLLLLGAKEPATVADAVDRIAGIERVVNVQPLYYDR